VHIERIHWMGWVVIMPAAPTSARGNISHSSSSGSSGDGSRSGGNSSNLSINRLTDPARQSALP